MKKSVLSIIITVALATATQAGIILSDNFNNYVPGNLVGNSGNALWAAHSGAGSGPIQVVTNDVSGTNMQIRVAFNANEDVNASPFTGGPYDSTNNASVIFLYSSFTAMYTNAPTLAGGAYIAHFKDSGTFNFRARLWAFTNGAAPGFYRLAIGATNSAFGTAGLTNWPTDLSTNVIYKVVTRINVTNGAATLWINPSFETDPSVDSDVFVPGVPISLSSYAFRQGNSGIGTAFIDDLKIGTQFSDVAGNNTSPTISAIPNQAVPASQTSVGPINFTIGDDLTPASSLTLSNSSSNPTLITTNNIIFGGSGANRTVTLNPNSGQEGVSTITIYVRDNVNLSSTSFTLGVGAPSITAIPNQITYLNVPTAALSFTIWDPETPNSLSLSNSFSSVNQNLISSISFGGSGSNRTVTVTPQAGETGVATIRIYVRDPSFNLISTSFILSVSPNPGLLFSDTFSYTDFLQDQALLGATGSPWGHASGTNFDLQLNNGAAELHFTRSEDLGANLAGGPYATTNGVVFYSGFTVFLTNLPSQLGNYFAHFKDSITGTSFRARVFASRTNAASGFYRIGIANQGAAASAQYPMDLSLNQVYLVVTRYNSGTGESVLWVNPANENSTSVAGLDDPSTSTIGAYGLRQDSFMGVVELDNLKVSTAFADVLTAVPLSAIPLNIQLDGSNVILTWGSAAFFLQSSTDMQGTYSTISGAASPYTNSLMGLQNFFRLVHTNSP